MKGGKQNDNNESLTKLEKIKLVEGYAEFIKLMYTSELFSRCVEETITDYISPLTNDEKIKFQNCLTNTVYAENMLKKNDNKMKNTIYLIRELSQDMGNKLQKDKLI